MGADPLTEKHSGFHKKRLAESLKKGNLHKTVLCLSITLKLLFAFDYTFQDQALFNSYQNDRRFSQIVNVFTILSMLIAFLGLFGLVGYTISKKTKEIGIRKILGASVSNIIALISGSFLRMIIIAAIIAFPIAWWVMSQWLSDFPYRVNMQAWFFLGAGAFVLLMALAVILAQTLKASLANPVEALKEE